MKAYFIETWDTDLQSFTPHNGIPPGPYTLFGLRVPIRELRSDGYPCDYSSMGSTTGDPGVSITSREIPETS
jgi:hypothetical protein